MDKLKKNAGIKTAAAIVLSVTLLGMLVSGLLGIWFFEEGAYTPSGKEIFKENVLRQVMFGYENDAVDNYANTYVYNNDVYYENGLLHNSEYHNGVNNDGYFNEENCNYFYKIEPLNEEDKEYPTVSNYYTDDYRFSYSDVRTIDKGSVQLDFTYKYPEEISKKIDAYYGYNNFYEYEGDNGTTEAVAYPEDGKSTIEAGTYDEREIEATTEVATVEDEKNSNETDNKINDIATDKANDKYKDEINSKFDEYYIKYLKDSGFNFAIYIGDEYRYDFQSDFSFRESFVKFVEDNNLQNYDSFEIFSARTEEDKHLTEYTILCSDTIEFLVTNYVKNDMEAHDNFTNGFSYYVLAGYTDYIIPAFIVAAVISLILIVFLVNAAGHTNQSDEIKENVLDRIPYDIVLLCLFTLGISLLEVILYDHDLKFFIGLGCACALLIPYVITTTATRLKVGSLFKNTIIYRIIKLLTLIYKKAKDLLKYLYKNANIYMRYIGIFGVLSLLEFFIVMASDSSGVMGLLWVIEKIAIIGILAVALINMDKLRTGAKEIAEGNSAYNVDTEKMLPSFKEHGVNLNRIQDGIAIAVDERMKSERMKTELITNVSHDIKTPLTSLISYVDLLEKENIDNEKAKEYIEVLDRQSAKLKKLIQDLIDASKASTGNLPVEMMKMDLKVMLDQVAGEFEEKLSSRNLKLNTKYCNEDVAVMADGKLLWRTLDNLFINIYKYAQENTRVYVDVDCLTSEETGSSEMVNISFKNISKEELNISGEELMERFVRGDSSRNTEGSGLGLSIARSLVELQGGKMEIVVDGDLFKVVISLAKAI